MPGVENIGFYFGLAWGAYAVVKNLVNLTSDFFVIFREQCQKETFKISDMLYGSNLFTVTKADKRKNIHLKKRIDLILECLQNVTRDVDKSK